MSTPPSPQRARTQEVEDEAQIEFDKTYPEFCNMIKHDNDDLMPDIGITKIRYSIIFNNKFAVGNPRELFFHKIEEAVNAAKATYPEAIRIGLELKTTCKETKIAHDLHVNWSKIDVDVAQILSNRVEQLHESNEAAELFEEKLTFEITLFSPILFGANDNLNDVNLITPNNDDGQCLFYCIYALLLLNQEKDLPSNISNQSVKRKSLTKKEIEMLEGMMQNITAETKKAVEVIRTLCGIKRNVKGYGSLSQLEKIQNYLNKTYDSKFRLVLFNYHDRTKPEFKGKAVNVTNELGLLVHKKHFHVIKDIHLFANGGNAKKYYCVDCEQTFSHPSRHGNCIRKCSLCARFGKGPCLNEMIKILCDLCNKMFFNKECHSFHLEKACELYKKCLECEVTYATRNKTPHECLTKFCKICSTFHFDRPCYIQKIETKKTPFYRIVVFDFEATQEKEITTNKFEHIVNFIAAYRFCTLCYAQNRWNDPHTKCIICGKGNRMVTWSALEGQENCLQLFVDWLFNSNKNYTTIALAHYAGRYDDIFILKELYNRNLGHLLKITKVGNKFYQISLAKTDNNPQITFKDSYNFASLPLSDMVKTFSLNIENKMFFPHMFNKKENYETELSHLPDASYYMPESMTVAKRKDFFKWYNDNYFTPFCLKTQIHIYCINDVEILKATIAEFRNIFIDSFKVDPIFYCATIASACMRSYRQNFLQENTIVIYPEGGFHRHSKASKAALKYFYWRRETTGVDIQFHDSVQGEKRIGKYIVDGFIEESNTCIEFNGCFFHGHLECLDPGTVLPTGRTAQQQNELTKEKENYLIAMNYNVETIWECHVEQMLSKNKDMSKFYNNVQVAGPLDPRDAYFGGRTGPLSLHEEIPEDDEMYTISLFDVRSLYPSMNYEVPYPVGIPELINIPPSEQNINWTKPEDIKYNGLLKVFVVPPKDLQLPVLPYKYNNWLLFLLCRSCGAYYEDKCTKDVNYKCKHNDEERGFITTTTSIELSLALEFKYVCTKFYSAYHFNEFSTNLFRPYVRQCIRLKAANDDFPAELITEEDKQEFIKGYKEKFEITLDRNQIRKNNGLRYISKLCANSLWGKFSIRNNLAKTTIVSTGLKANKIFDNDKYIISSVDKINEKEVMVVYTLHKDCIEENPCSSIILSIWTTSSARITLYRYMDAVQKNKNCRLLYTDTDSILCKHLKNELPFKIGLYLGDMALEIRNIVEFVSGGCKQIAYKILEDLLKKLYSFILKIRGISLTSKVCESLHFETFKQMVLGYGDGKNMALPVSRIAPHRTGHVYTVNTEKVYRAIYQKGIILDNLDIIPFGAD